MTDLPEPKLKCGFAVMVGRSNVGKSTLLNTLVGSKIAITTPKPQTTRQPVQGIVTEERGQIVFVDTPGVFAQAKDALTKKLTKFVSESLRDIDVIIYVVDPTRAIGNEEKLALQMVKNADVPKILVINKMDEKKKDYLDSYRDLSDGFDQTIELSALHGTNKNYLLDAIFERLPLGEFFYPPGQLTNMPNEQWLAELIREKLFLRLRQEVPYSVHVEVEELEKRENGTMYIRATIYTLDRRYKSMIVGKGGQGVKEVGQAARRELQTVMNAPVYLDLNVECDPHWTERIG